MRPRLKSGDEVLAKRTRQISIGDLVIARHPIQSDLRLIKQIEAIENDHVILSGFNKSASSDSHQFGLVASGFIFGTITSRLE